MLRWMAAAALAFVAPLAAACAICVSEPLKYAFKRAPAVFVGTLTDVDERGVSRFRVEKRWKGPDGEVYAVNNPPTNCMKEGLRIGESYVVVPGDNWFINCGSYVYAAESPERQLIERRARWWRCPLSSFTFYAIARRIGGW